ncbi:MAG: response regulator [Alphaproteobacteria bacterium]|nr:MAG: response regulator [Alphaproteobacteria bacterium]
MARILLAEDDEAVRSFVRRALESAGHEVVEVTDGGQALERLAAERYDLLLSDIVMPVMDGIALALKVTAERPELPILLMTGFAAEKQRAHNLEALTTEVLSKPFTMDQLLRTVRRALEKGASAD